MSKLKRLFGSYSQGNPGPLFICVAGMHGNEWAGVRALELIMKMLEVEPITNPNFRFYGKMICLLGNIPALKNQTRYIEEDLNRVWTEDLTDRLRDPDRCTMDVREAGKLKRYIDRELKQWQGDKVYLLDLHTTTASGGIFTLPTRQKESLQVAKTMHAPVITGLVERLQGTLLRYYTQIQPDERMVGIVFEAGQHDDPLSINRSIAAVINCMRTVGCVLPEHIVNHHDQLLLTYAEGLPRVARLLYSHSISSDDEFRMLPGFRNFQPVRKGQLLAHDRLGEIHAREDGLILMPHYQKQGNDGFFLVREV